MMIRILDVLIEALSSLRNLQCRMDYSLFRREGSPITTCYVESAFKQINQHMKGTEKIWTEPWSKAILQLWPTY